MPRGITTPSIVCSSRKRRSKDSRSRRMTSRFPPIAKGVSPYSKARIESCVLKVWTGSHRNDLEAGPYDRRAHGQWNRELHCLDEGMLQGVERSGLSIATGSRESRAMAMPTERYRLSGYDQLGIELPYSVMQAPNAVTSLENPGVAASYGVSCRPRASICATRCRDAGRSGAGRLRRTPVPP